MIPGCMQLAPFRSRFDDRSDNFDIQVLQGRETGQIQYHSMMLPIMLTFIVGLGSP